MATKTRVFEPLTAEHFTEAVNELYETYQVQYVFPVYLGDMLFSGIAIYDDGTTSLSTLSEEVQEDGGQDTTGTDAGTTTKTTSSKG